jgi:hypothetical protein
VLSDNSGSGIAADAAAGHLSGRLPAGAVSPQVSLRRSRIGWLVPVLGMPVILALSAVLAGTGLTPPGIGILAFFWGMAQTVLVGGPTGPTGMRHPPQVDHAQMLMTKRSWTGTRTINLARLTRVRRVKWTFSGEYSSGRTVDYLICTDSTGVRMTLPRAAIGPVRSALAFQHKHGLPEARVSRFAAISLRQAPDSVGFRAARTLLVLAVVIAYLAVVAELIVVAIPALAPGR